MYLLTYCTFHKMDVYIMNFCQNSRSGCLVHEMSGFTLWMTYYYMHLYFFLFVFLTYNRITVSNIR